MLGAKELREPPQPVPVDASAVMAALTVTQLFDSIAVRIDGERAWDTTASIRWQLTGSGENYRMELSNGALIHHPTNRDEPADLTITLTHPQLLALLSGTGSDGIQFDGDQSVLGTILGFTGEPDTAMRIVSP